MPEHGPQVAAFWRAVFGRDGVAVEVEIGPGRGEVLFASAAAAPRRLFLGVERRAARAEALAAEAAARGLGNVRIVTADARCVVAHLIPPTSVAAYHVYFPDPWPKNRHRARRLFAGDFPAALVRTLAPGGVVHLATDLPALLEAMAAALARAGLVRDRGAAPPAGRPVTAFERRYARAGTYCARLERPADGSASGVQGRVRESI
ncbi:MAG TPA: tRNA (guanosine(46)-N7)-methyltransferase TrmB [Candidatus Binatia bacterium]|nr:tRNA (guanosine(46)-N7)-methyltransferase TrmB [Candidatus Binatia bacterium]